MSYRRFADPSGGGPGPGGRRANAWLVASFAVAGLLSGCLPQPTSPGAGGYSWANPLNSLESAVARDPKDVDYILTRMEYGREAIRQGSYMCAKPKLLEAFKQLESEQENVAAAVSSERLKYYKGETYEQAMLCCYLGLAEYMSGNYTDARIFFSRALSADRAAVVKKSTPEVYGDDFGLAYYWLGKTYGKLNRDSNTRIAFEKAAVVAPRKEADRELAKDKDEAVKFGKWEAEGERWAYKTFHDPQQKQLYMADIIDLAAVGEELSAAPAQLPFAAEHNPVLRSAAGREEFFTKDYQAEANTVLMIEVGECPAKYLTGLHQERTELARPYIRPQHVNVYVDGHLGGQAFKVLDLWDQAATQDRVLEKETAQAGKAILKEVLSHAPYAGSLAGHWDVSGDMRHWQSLPGRVYIYAAKLSPGCHTIRLEMYDANGKLLPRWTNTVHGIGVPKSGEACVLLDPRFDGDNMLTPDCQRKAREAGARPEVQSPTPAVAGPQW